MMICLLEIKSLFRYFWWGNASLDSPLTHHLPECLCVTGRGQMQICYDPRVVFLKLWVVTLSQGWARPPEISDIYIAISIVFILQLVL